MRPFVPLFFLSASIICATPPDPICARPSSYARVTAIRAARTSEKAAQSIIVPAVEVPPSLAVHRTRPLDLPRLVITGTAGKNYDLEATTYLHSESWTSLLSLFLGSEGLNWEDPLGLAAPAQFYRLRASDVERLAEPASNFRLLDQQGAARDLYYHNHLKAIVILAAGDNLTNISTLLPVMNELSDMYGNRVLTWILLSDTSPGRSNLLAQSKNLGIAFPVLSDSHDLAARAVGLTRMGDVAVIQPPDFNVLYRGSVSAFPNNLAGQTYLGQALAHAVSNQPVTFRRTTSAGALLNDVVGATPDYCTEVGPILSQYCTTCHRPNSVAPFALTNYSVVREWSASIKNALVSRQMPPWHADPEYGHFTNDISLPEKFRSVLVRWLDAGAPRGQGPDPLVELPSNHQYDEIPPDLGEPDQIIKIPAQSIKATGSEAYRYIFARASNTSNVWLRAAIVRHSTYPAVHHSLVWLGQVGQTGTTDNSSYVPYIAEYVPGYKPFHFPADAGVLFVKSNWVTFNLHYNTTGTATNDQPVLYLWYHKVKPARTWTTAMAVTDQFSIPPGAADYPVKTEVTFQSQVTLYRLNPHMHVRGKRMQFDAVYPNGRRERLLSVPDYDFMWQVGYQLAEPKVLPAGTRLLISGAFDNSPQNPANPNPAATVRWGDQSWMEMFVGFLEYSQ